MKKLSKYSKHAIFLLNRGNAVKTSEYSDMYGNWTLPRGCVRLSVKDITTDIINELDDITKETILALLDTAAKKIVFINNLDLARSSAIDESERNLLRYLKLMNDVINMILLFLSLLLYY